ALVLFGGGTVPRTQQTVEVIAALEEQVRVAEADSGNAGRLAAKDLAQFADLLDGACITGHPVPELPAEFLDGALERSLFVPELAARYVECAHQQFSDLFVTDAGWTEETGLELYFRTLLAAGADDFATKDFEVLLAVEPLRRDRETDIGWG